MGVATTVSALTGSSGSPRKYTQDQKDEFFTVLDLLGSATLAAAELGLNRNTCMQWARKAGIAGKPGRSPHPGRGEYFRLRQSGTTRREAACAVGINLRTAEDWDRGVKKSKSTRTYPDGRVVDYKQGVTTFNTAAGKPVSAASPGTAELEKLIDPRYLSLTERERIRDLSAPGASLRKIAAALGRPVSTVSREIVRNSTPDGNYQRYAAHRAAAARRPPPCRRTCEAP